MDELVSIFLSFGKLFVDSLSLDAGEVLLGSGFHSFCDFLIKNLLLSLSSLGKLGLELLFLLEAFSLAVELSGMNILEDVVMLVNELVLLVDSGILKTDIWIGHDQLLVLLSLESSFFLLLSSKSDLLDLLGSKSLSLVDLEAKLLSINFISDLLLVNQHLVVVVILVLLGLSTSLKIFLIVESSLDSLQLLLLFLFLELLLSLLELLGNSLSILLLSIGNHSLLELLLKEQWQFGEVLFELGELSFMNDFHL